MGTKTISIMDDVYGILVDNKLEEESFSEELRRILSKKKTKKLIDFFGILSEEEGAGMLEDLERIKAENRKLLRKKLGVWMKVLDSSFLIDLINGKKETKNISDLPNLFTTQINMFEIIRGFFLRKISTSSTWVSTELERMPIFFIR